MIKRGGKFAISISLLVCVFSSCTEDIKTSKMYKEGEQIYLINCSRCHGEQGEGLGVLYPPLKNSKHLLENKRRIACSVKYGLKGKMLMDGVEYSQWMPALGKIKEHELAELITFLTNTWGYNEGIYTSEMVKQDLDKCKEQKNYE